MIVVTRTLTCNGCGWWLDIVGDESVALQRRLAREHGWKVALPGGVDYCHNCAWLADAKVVTL